MLNTELQGSNNPEETNNPAETTNAESTQLIMLSVQTNNPDEEKLVTLSQSCQTNNAEDYTNPVKLIMLSKLIILKATKLIILRKLIILLKR